jgi:hypothetical protein
MLLKLHHNIQTDQNAHILIDESGKILGYFEETETAVIRCMIDYCGNYWAEYRSKSDPAEFHFTHNKKYVDGALDTIGRMDNDWTYEPIGDCPDKL